jgi:hypothetical protein
LVPPMSPVRSFMFDPINPAGAASAATGCL